MSNEHVICLLNDSFPPFIDGVSNTVLNYARVINENHGKSLVVTPSVSGVKDNYPFPVVRFTSIDTRKRLGYVTGYPFSPEAAKAVGKSGTQLLHAHCPFATALLGRELAGAFNLPLIMTWHTKYDVDIAKAVKFRILKAGALKALMSNVNACDEVWTVSKGAGENLKSLGYEGEFIVMPNGVDLPRAKVDEAVVEDTVGSYDLPQDIPCYLFIGRMMWYKGIRIILDALAMHKKSGADFRMVFVGSGADFEEIKKYAEEAGIADKTIFTGPIRNREALRAWYQRADLFLFPSTYDTNGLVVREAAASDTAAILVEGSCAAEDVTDGRNGFFIKENADSLAAKLAELSKNPERVKEVGVNAGNEIYISWEDAVARACDRYDIVIDKFRRGDYGIRDPLKGSWMQSQGELMQIVGQFRDINRSLRTNIIGGMKDKVVNVLSRDDE